MFDELIPDPDAGAELNRTDVLTYILGGNSLFTIQSHKTGARFTYRVRTPQGKKNPHFVGLLSGPFNTVDYTYMGTIFEGTNVRLTSKSRVGPDAPSYKALFWVIERLRAEKPLVGCTVYHHGTCGVCGRTLTVPESIERGIGPVCWEKI